MKQNQKRKTPHTFLERRNIRFISNKTRILRVKIWWSSRKKNRAFFVPFKWYSKMRLSGQFQASLLFFTKRFWAYKNANQPKPTNQQNKNKRTKNNKDNGFSCTQKLLRRWLDFGASSTIFSLKKLAWNCPHSLVFLYYSFILSEGSFFNIYVLSQCIVYWIHFQNTYTFTYNISFFLLESLHYVLKVNLKSRNLQNQIRRLNGK